MLLKQKSEAVSLALRKLGWKMGLERLSRGEDTFENIYTNILATLLK